MKLGTLRSRVDGDERSANSITAHLANKTAHNNRYSGMKCGGLLIYSSVVRIVGKLARYSVNEHAIRSYLAP